MHFVVRRDLDAPADYVFDSFSDFEGFERLATLRGAKVRRLGGTDPAWQVQFALNRKPRRLAVRLEEAARPGSMLFDGESKHMNGDLRLDFATLGAERTRLTLRFEMKPVTLTARIMLQTLRLGRGRMTARLHGGLDRLAYGIETRFRAGEPARI